MPVKSPKSVKQGKSTPRAQKPAPASAKRAGRPKLEPIRWTIHKAAVEFGKERTFIDQLRRRKHIEPAKDGKFSTLQIVEMLFTDKAKADAISAQANAEAAVRRNQREAGELIPTREVNTVLDPIGIILRQKICASSMTEYEKDEMLADLEKQISAIDWEKVARNTLEK